MATYSGIYRLKNVGTGYYLTMTTAEPEQPVVCAQTQPGDKRSLWRITSAPDGAYKFKNEEHNLELQRPTKSVSIYGAPEGFAFYITGPDNARKIRSKATRGTILQQEPSGRKKDQITSAVEDSAATHQQWIFEKVQDDPNPGPGPGPGPQPGPEPNPCTKPGKYVIRNVKSGTVVDLEKMTPGDNVKIFGFQGNGGENQKWDIQPSATSPHMTLLCVATTKYATHPTPKEGESLLSSGQAQECFIIPADKGFYIGPVQKPGYVWTLRGGNSANETPILLSMNHGLDEQKWRFEAV
ncbi:hypothetical protein RSAG8_10095, partial [Rhizoctonia solani AG-8 WAC10335]